jgi:membrane protease YdiL (CAAX protease family)
LRFGLSGQGDRDTIGKWARDHTATRRSIPFMVPFTVTDILRGMLHWLILAIMCGVLACWVWVIHTWLSRRTLWPETPLVERRPAPWGFWTILLVLATYAFVSHHALKRYALATRGKAAIVRAEAPARIEKGAEEPGPNARHDEAESLPYGLSLTELMFVQAAINSLLIVVVPVMVRWTSGARPRDFGLSLRDGKWQAAIGAVAVLFLMPIVYAVQLVCVKYLDTPDPQQHRHPVERMIRENFSPGVAYLAFLSAVILAPLIEELLFRGIIQSWLVKVFDQLARRSRRSLVFRHPVHSMADPERPSGPGTGSDLADPYLVRSSSDEGREIVYPAEADDERPMIAELEIASERHWGSLEDIPDPEKWRRPAAGGSKSPYRPLSLAGTGAAIALTSLIFAALHAPQWPAPIPLFLLSLGLGVVYQRTGGLIAPICMHAIFNAFSTLTLFAVALEPPKTKPPAQPVLERPAPMERGGVEVPDVGLKPRHDKT